ncbi:unnamed protein product, partial [Didymodactylos carnosus]
ALQIRLAGMKCVLVRVPKLNNQHLIQVRQSQVKFESNHYDLEVNDFSKPCNLTLNR